MENESREESMFKISLVEKQMQELAEKTEYISQQLLDLESFGKNLKSNRSKPPPEAPTRYSKPFSGGRPVSAINQVARINS